MIYTDKTKQALKLMFTKHKEQVDKSGLPYVFHPFTVAQSMDDEDSTIVALLHDVIEDTNTTIDELVKMGFNDEIIDALKILTHDKTVEYFDYVKKIKLNPLATKVKISDLKNNSDLSRLNNPTQKDIERVEKYKKALKILNDN